MGKTFGIISLLCAIISIILITMLYVMPVTSLSMALMMVTTLPTVGLIISLVGIIMGIVGIKKDDGSALAIVGLVLSVCMFVCYLFFVLIIGALMTGIGMGTY